MNRTQFTEKLKSNWSKVSPAVLEAIEKKLSFYSENDINEIWIQLHETYNQVSAPTYAHVINVIKILGVQQCRGEGHKREYVYICSDCKTNYKNPTYSLLAICCPNCLSERNSLQEYDGNTHHKVITYQYQCFRGNAESHFSPTQCLMFNQSGAYGPMCKSWGLQKNTPECRDCICSDCCSKLIAENKAYVQRERAFNIPPVKDVGV